MTDETKRKRGGQQGNQNARKHGFYSRVLDERERRDFEQAAGVEGIDEEIALLRVKLKSVLLHDPDNLKLIIRATGSLERLIRTRHNLNKEQKQGLTEAIGNVLKDVAIPLGIDIFTLLKK
jgi:hypothetical protein